MANIPLPGRPVRGSQRGRPVMALLDLLGRRWALRVIWELREQALSFRELQARCGAISSSVLNQRLSELRAAGAIERARDGYRLSREGRRLLELYPPLHAWAERWARRGAVAARPASAPRSSARARRSPPGPASRRRRSPPAAR